MNKAQLTKALAETIGMKKKDARLATDTIFDLIGQALEAGEKVQISGFGSFEPKSRTERTGRNPLTHEEIRIPAYRGIHFSPSKILKHNINQKG